jgi:ATP-dependent RNA helicase RhlE
VAQRVHPVDKARKREMLSHLIGRGNWRQVLVFTRTKHGANRLARQLEADGLSTSAIHGNKSQAARTRALADFKKGSVRVLVATDIAARGLDIDQLPHVVNFDLPNVPEDYVHRIGRTGRAGREGEALSLVSADEAGQLADIEKLLGRSLAREELEGYEPRHHVPAAAPAAGNGCHASNGRSGNGRQGNGRSGNGNSGNGRRANGGSAHGQRSHGRRSGGRSSGGSSLGRRRSSSARGGRGQRAQGGWSR